MRIVLDNVDGSIYGDIILSTQEMDRMRMGEMIDGFTTHNQRRYYLGVRLQSIWEYIDEEDEEIAEED